MPTNPHTILSIKLIARFVLFFKRDETAPLHHPQNGHHNMLPAQQQPMMMDPYNRQPSTVDFDGRVVHSRSGDIIGKNSAV